MDINKFSKSILIELLREQNEDEENQQEEQRPSPEEQQTPENLEGGGGYEDQEYPDPNDPNAMGGFGMDQQQPLTAEEIGRIYELKKIYYRLVTLRDHLSESSDEDLLLLRNYVSDAVELFETLISNIDSFKDKIDEIIVVYYKFLVMAYTILKDHLKKRQDEESGKSEKKK